MAPTSVHAADGELRDELLGIEQRRQDALIAGDLDALDALFDESLVHVHAPGLIHSKAQLLEHSGSRRAYLAITRSDLVVRVVGDVAIITGEITNRLRTAEGGERELSGVATQVLHRDTDGAWRFISFQMTPYGEQAWPALPSENEEKESR